MQHPGPTVFFGEFFTSKRISELISKGIPLPSSATRSIWKIFDDTLAKRNTFQSRYHPLEPFQQEKQTELTLGKGSNRRYGFWTATLWFNRWWDTLSSQLCEGVYSTTTLFQNRITHTSISWHIPLTLKDVFSLRMVICLNPFLILDSKILMSYLAMKILDPKLQDGVHEWRGGRRLVKEGDRLYLEGTTTLAGRWTFYAVLMEPGTSRCIDHLLLPFLIIRPDYSSKNFSVSSL